MMLSGRSGNIEGDESAESHIYAQQLYNHRLVCCVVLMKTSPFFSFPRCLVMIAFHSYLKLSTEDTMASAFIGESEEEGFHCMDYPTLMYGSDMFNKIGWVCFKIF